MLRRCWLCAVFWPCNARERENAGVAFRRRRRETSVSELLVSRRADELERFQKWSDTPAAVEVREARSDRRHSICRAAFVSRKFVHKEILRREIGADDPSPFLLHTLWPLGSGAQTRQSGLFG